MIILNSRRILTSILREVCAERCVQLDSLSSDWIFRLTRNGCVKYVFGYDFALNNSTAQMIAKDKSATAELLQLNNISAVPHHLFHGPQLTGYIPLTGNWQAILELFQRYENNVVCKKNEGTGGSDVFRAKTVNELEAAVHRILQRSRSLCISPYLPIDNEYRTIILDGHVELVYAKSRLALWGDGASSIHDLLLQFIASHGDRDAVWSIAIDGIEGVDINAIPAPGEPFYLNWKHNLGQGSQANLVDPTDPIWSVIASMALSAGEAIDISFASVDIVETQGDFKVLEINSGIMMESFVKQQGSHHAKRIYDRAVCLMFDI